jgi:hypothetical protein
MCAAAESACPSLWPVVTTCHLFSQPTFLVDVGQAATEVLTTPYKKSCRGIAAPAGAEHHSKVKFSERH